MLIIDEKSLRILEMCLNEKTADVAKDEGLSVNRICQISSQAAENISMHYPGLIIDCGCFECKNGVRPHVWHSVSTCRQSKAIWIIAINAYRNLAKQYDQILKKIGNDPA